MLDLFFLQMPATTTGWLATSEQFEKTWNYLHSLGGMDGSMLSYRHLSVLELATITSQH